MTTYTRYLLLYLTLLVPVAIWNPGRALADWYQPPAPLVGNWHPPLLPPSPWSWWHPPLLPPGTVTGHSRVSSGFNQDEMK